MDRMLRLLLVLMLCGLMAGCEAESDSAGPGLPATIDMTGTWKGWGDIVGVEMTAVLVQDDSSFTGTFEDTDGDTGTFTGSVSGDSVEIIFAYDDPDIGVWGTMTGTISSGSTMGSGSWEARGFSGSWSARKIS